jgi:hypothetical protein
VKSSGKQSMDLFSGFLISLFFDPEAICSFETSADLQRTTRRYIIEDMTLVIVTNQNSAPTHGFNNIPIPLVGEGTITFTG